MYVFEAILFVALMKDDDYMRARACVCVCVCVFVYLCVCVPVCSSLPLFSVLALV